jgi:hypothetical protein
MHFHLVTRKTTKLVLHFLGFSTMLYDFYKTLDQNKRKLRIFFYDSP